MDQRNPYERANSAVKYAMAELNEEMAPILEKLRTDIRVAAERTYRELYPIINPEALRIVGERYSMDVANPLEAKLYDLVNETIVNTRF